MLEVPFCASHTAAPKRHSPFVDSKPQGILNKVLLGRGKRNTTTAVRGAVGEDARSAERQRKLQDSRVVRTGFSAENFPTTRPHGNTTDCLKMECTPSSR